MECVARRSEFHQPIQRDLGRPARPPKIIRFTFFENDVLIASSRLMKRGVRVVTIRGVRAAVDAMALRAREIAGRQKPVSDRSRAGRATLLRTAKPCGPGARGWRQVGGGVAGPTGRANAVNSPMTEAKGIRLRGELGISRQTIAQGRPDALRWTCMLVCALLCANCTRDRGCSAHPVFPAPSH